MQTNDENTDREQIARVAQAYDRMIIGQRLMANECILQNRKMIDTALGAAILMKIGEQINNGALKPLDTALAQMIGQFEKGFNITTEQARLCVMWAIVNPDKLTPKPPRLATRQERRKVGKK